MNRIHAILRALRRDPVTRITRELDRIDAGWPVRDRKARGGWPAGSDIFPAARKPRQVTR